MPGPAAYETRHDACQVLGTHRHDGAYAALVLDGHHVEASADGPVKCTPGTVVLHPRWHAHGNRFGRTGARVVNVDLDPALAPDTLRVLRVADLREASSVFARAPHHLAGLIEACSEVERAAAPGWQAEFLHGLQHGDAPLSLLARRAGVSLAHASRTFLKSHGMPPQLLRRELRCRRALSLLGGAQSLARIAADSGFADQSHLSRSLRQATGSPPAQLRRQIKCVQDAGPHAIVQ